jgi:hypothetical protein
MILTKEVFSALGACAEGYEVAIRTNNIGKEYDEVIAYCLSNNLKVFGKWLQDKKLTGTYVRLNGEVITMNQTYQVFNPLTGTHVEYLDEASARAAMVEIGNNLLKNYPINIVQAISNEKGDSAWVPITLSNPLTVV